MIISTLYFGVFYTKKEGLKNEKASKRNFSSKYRYLNIYWSAYEIAWN